VVGVGVRGGWRAPQLGRCLRISRQGASFNAHPPLLCALQAPCLSVNAAPSPSTTDTHHHQQLPGLPPDHSCGQPVWTPDGRGLVFVAWPHAPPNFPTTLRRLGIVFCYNRPCFLFHVPYAAPPPPASAEAAETNGKPADPASADKAEAAEDEEAAQPPASKLSGALLSAFAPVFSPDGRLLVFLSADAAARTGVHAGTTSLHSLAWPPGARSPKTVVPVVQRAASAGGFPGLYSGGFPEAAFLTDRIVLVNSQWYSQGVALAVQLDTGDVAPVTPVGWEHGSWAVQVRVLGVGGVAAGWRAGSANIFMLCVVIMHTKPLVRQAAQGEAPTQQTNKPNKPNKPNTPIHNTKGRLQRPDRRHCQPPQ